MANMMISIFIVLGCFTFIAMAYLLFLAMASKIEEKTAERKRLKTLEGKIDKMNDLICDIHYEGGRIKANGKYLVLEDMLGAELSDKKID